MLTSSWHPAISPARDPLSHKKAMRSPDPVFQVCPALSSLTAHLPPTAHQLWPTPGPVYHLYQPPMQPDLPVPQKHPELTVALQRLLSRTLSSSPGPLSEPAPRSVHCLSRGARRTPASQHRKLPMSFSRVLHERPIAAGPVLSPGTPLELCAWTLVIPEGWCIALESA